ncbi:MAG: ROK family protein [Actinomycetota bacterium]|nr:ROK family protein [Actinomycetota bacterium]
MPRATRLPKSSAAAHTLVIDIGGTGLKATVLGPGGQPEHARIRAETTYPCPPEKLVADLVALVKPLPAYQRVSAGFPGVVRGGTVLTAPHFVTEHGPGSRVDNALTEKWTDFDLGGALGSALGAPVRVANDADVQGAGVVSGKGLERVLTLGTGLGSSTFRDGRLALHLELAHHPAVNGVTYNDYIGDAARKQLGTKRWNRRVRKALLALDALICPDAVLLGGGNAAKVDTAKLQQKDAVLAVKVRVVGNEGGLLGGIRLWTGAGLE